MRTFSFEAAEEFVKDRLEDFLQQRGINTRRAFRCLNPAHEDRRPSMSINRNAGDGHPRAHCFSCGANYSTFDIIANDYGLSDNKDIFAKAYELFNIQLENTITPAAPSMSARAPKQALDKLRQEASAAPDFTRAATEAAAALLNSPKALDYLENKRGLARETIEAYKLGYCAEGYNSFLQDYEEYQSKSQKAQLYRLFIPFWSEGGKCEYFIAEIANRDPVDKYNPKYRNVKGLPIPIFNERRIGAAPAVFVCEGIYDALSVETAGGAAIALLGLGYNKFLDKVKASSPDCVFVLCLDNDVPGKERAQELSAELEAIGAACLTAQLPDDYKDANEFLTKDRAAFAEFIGEYVQKADDIKNKDRNEYLRTSAKFALSEFWEKVDSKRDPIPTGLKPLDDILDGGLFPGLYVIGAVSSLGKTTLALQIADNIAETGEDVLIFSLEQGKCELFAKSFSRITYQQHRQFAKTALDFLRGAAFNEDETNNKRVFETLNKYNEFAEHIYIHEGAGLVGVNKIRAEVAKHVKFTQKKPIIVVDYLQILAPIGGEYASDKQNVDRNITELKRLSRDYDITILAISSFNRENYTAPVGLGSFKESGMIEYSSDVLIGLQFEGMDYRQGERDIDRAQRVRETLSEQLEAGRAGASQRIEVKILKNRNGAKGSAALDFCPKFNCFTAKTEIGEMGKI